MSVLLSEVDIARFLGQTIAETRKSIKKSRLKGVLRHGHLVFPREEVLNWLAENFTSLTSERLMKADRSSADEAGLDPFSCGISQLLSECGVCFPAKVSTRSKIIRYLSEKAVECGALYDEAELREQLEAREQVSPTALKCGAALVHPLNIRKLYMERELLMLAIPPHPIPFGEPTGKLTSLFFLLLFPNANKHIHVLARLNRLLRNSVFVDDLLTGETSDDVINSVYRHELDLISGNN